VPLWALHDFGDQVGSIDMTDDGSLIACATWGPMDNSTPDLYVFRKESPVPIGTLNTPGSLHFVSIAPDGSKGVIAGKAYHERTTGLGGTAYLFRPVPSSFGNITGNVDVIGAADNSGVSLVLESIDDYYAFSNEAGDFNIKYIPGGVYSLTASKPGYISKTIENILVTGGNTAEVTLELYPDSEPPPPPTNLKYTPYYEVAPEFVMILWDKPDIDDLDYFNVTIVNKNTETEETIKATDNQLIYFVEDLTTYHVTVTTMNTAAQESVPSEILEIDVKLGIVDLKASCFKIYPNPTTGELIIENGELRIENVEIYNIVGQKQKIIFNFQFSTFNSIDISHFPAGTYFIKVGNSAQKFIKK